MKDEHNIDQLFKAGLGDPEIPFNEMDWEKMSKKLDAYEKKRVFPLWWLAGAGVAAAVLIFLFTILLKEEPVGRKPLNNNALNSAKKPIEKWNKIEVPVKETAVTPAEDKNLAEHENKNTGTAGLQNHQSRPVEQETRLASTGSTLPAKVFAADFPLNSFRGDTAQFIPMKAYKGRPVAKLARLLTEKRPGLSFSIMAAPDISATGADLSSKVSTNVGLLLTYPISNKISVSTGLIYAKKLYNSAGIAAADNGYGNQSWEVNADCKVLDIPLNINYQVFKKRKLAVSINTGLSSYLMLNERYDLRTGPNRIASKVEVSNKNQHILGVANLSLSVERKINSSMSIGLQPFVKLPLTGIGNYDVRLNSTGVSVLLNFSKLN